MPFIIILIALITMAASLIYLGLKEPGIAFIAAPIVAGFFLWAGIVAGSILAVVIAPFLYVLTLISIVSDRRDEFADRWPRRWAIVILVTVLLIGLLIGAVMIWPIAGYSLVFFAILVGSIISFSIASRTAVATYVISTVGASMRQNLPLPMALESAASGQKDERARTLRRISKWLVQGYSLSEAIKRGFVKCPGYAVSIIAAAEKINQLPAAFESLEADMIAKTSESRRLRPIHPLYPLILFVLIFLILMGMMILIMPKFSEVLYEMGGASLPAATIRLMQIADFFLYRYGWIFFAPLLIAIPISIRVKFRPRRPDNPYLLSRIGDFLKWHLPVLHWFEYNYSMVHLIELLRVSLAAGCTVNDAIANTLGLDLNNRFRRGIVEWLDRVRSGEDIAKAASQSGLGTSLVWAFESGANTPAILETLEDFYRFNYSYRVNLARFIFWPCVNIAMGVLVGVIVYSFFAPMVAIINLLVNQVVS
jgi:type IV pilus assembly protein PilC